MNRTQENVLLVALFGTALLILGWVVGQVLPRPQVDAQETGSPVPVTFTDSPPFFVTDVPVATREPAEATEIAELQATITDAYTNPPTPASNCESIEIDLSGNNTYTLVLDETKHILYETENEQIRPFAPIVDGIVVVSGMEYNNNLSIPPLWQSIYPVMPFPPGSYTLTLEHWGDEFDDAFYTIYICPTEF